MMLLDSCDHTEFCCKCSKAFFLGGLCKTFVHIRPLVVLSVSSVLEIGCGITDTLEFLKPHFCMLFFVICGFEEKCSNLFKSVFLCFGSKISVLVACLALSCESSLKILFCLCSCVLVGHFVFLLLVINNIDCFLKNLFIMNIIHTSQLKYNIRSMILF